MSVKRIAVLGCTGSIGTTTLNILRRFPDDFEIVFLANYSDKNKLELLKKEFKTQGYCISSESDKDILARPELYQNVDIVVNGIAGIAGFLPAYAVLQAGKILATANKECLVCGGNLLKSVMRQYGGKIYPLDSEHSAVWQCLQGREKGIKRLLLTCSGGAFRDYGREELQNVTAEEALKHPNWKMGKKVTVDCATLVNKGFEIIEARHLFDTENVEAVYHRESLVHGLVEFTDNSVLASISVPDMTLPVQYALFYPERKESTVPPFDFTQGNISFGKIDKERFPAYATCLEAAKRGDKGGTVLSSADEVLVQAFLSGKVSFYGIAEGLEKALKTFQEQGNFTCFEDVLRMDKAVREYIVSDIVK